MAPRQASIDADPAPPAPRGWGHPLAGTEASEQDGPARETSGQGAPGQGQAGRAPLADALGPGSRNVGAQLARADLTGRDLSGAELSGADLTGARLLGANLTGASLHGACLDDADFTGADLTGANLSEASAKRAGFGLAKLESATLFGGCFSDATFTGAKLRGADLRTATLQGARFRDADLRDVAADRASLRGADLEGADVAGASFPDADLRTSRLRRLRGYESAGFLRTDIRDVDFSGAYLVRRQIMDENYLEEFRSRSVANRIVHAVWLVTSDCGRSALRWSAWTLVIAGAFGLAYSHVGIDFGDHPTAFSPYYFSIVTLTTLGYGDVLPITTAGQVLATAEALCGYVMLGGLLSIFSNKLARRAD